MEIKIPRSKLLKGLSLIQGVVEKKSTMPILSNTLFEATANNLTLTATDLEVGVINVLPAEVISEGRVAIHARGIYDIVRELSDNIVHLKKEENNWVTIICGSSDFRIMGLAPEEFPTLPKKGEGSQASIEIDALKSLIEKTAFAMSTDETRYALNGVYLEQTSSKDRVTIRMVATDGHRLSMAQRDIAKGWTFKKGVILPRKGVAELKKLMEGTEEDEKTIDLWIDEKHAIAYRGNVTLVLRLIDGQFPPYNHVIPKDSRRRVSVNREGIVHALRRVSVVASGQARGVRFSVSPKNMEISSSNPDFGEAHEEMAAQYKGEKFEVGFNARYFLDVLSVLDDEEAVLNMGDDTSPCLISSEVDPGFTHIIMPMRL